MYEVKIKYVNGGVLLFKATKEEVDDMFDNINSEEYDNVVSVLVKTL